MRRRRVSKIDVNMFPFLSVLCSVIGVLMLFMLLIIGTRVMDEASAEPVPDEEPMPPPPMPVVDTQLDGSIDEESYQRIARQVALLAETLLDRQRGLSELKQTVIQLEELIAEWEDKQVTIDLDGGLVTGVQLDKPEDVTLREAENFRVKEKPIFIEVTSEAYLVHPDKTIYAVEQIDRSGSPLRQFLADVDRRREKEYLLLLVHPSGASAQTRLKDYVVKTYPHPKPEYREALSRIGMGWEPFSPGWLLISQQLQSAQGQNRETSNPLEDQGQ